MLVTFFSTNRTEILYGEDRNPKRWAEIFFTDETTTFNHETRKKAGNALLFIMRGLDLDLSHLEAVVSEIQTIAEEWGSDAVFVCSDEYFKKVIKKTKKDELNAKLLITEDRKMLFWAAFGRDDSSLLVAYDSYKDK